MKATQTLPAIYTPYDNFRPSKWRRIHWVIWAFGIALAWLAYSVLRLIAQIIRPDFQPQPLHFEVPAFERLGSILAVVLALAAVFVVHEFLHAVFLWFSTGQRPIIIAKDGGLAVRLPTWYIPRDQFLIANLAPLCIISVVGLLFLLVVPQEHISLVVFLMAMNVAGSAADIASSVYLFLHPSSIYLETEGTIYFDGFVESDSVPEWKLRARSLAEAAITGLDAPDELG